MSSSADRDLPMVAMRLVTLFTGFYLICGASLTVLRMLYEHTSLHHRSDGGGDLQREQRYIGNTFASVKSIVWMGLLLPSIGWTLLQRLMVVVGMSALVASIVDIFRSVADYVVSTYILHVVVATCAMGSFPVSAPWWAIVATECALIVILSEFLVARKQRFAMARTVRRIEGGSCDDDDAV